MSIGDPRAIWEASFEAQIAQSAYNTAPVEALIRTVAYWLRERQESASGLSFLEMGCGAGPNLLWLAQKGIRVSGIDIAPTALELARGVLRPVSDRVEALVEGSVTDTPFPDGHFDGILESCVFQHLDREGRARAFAEVRRLLKPGGLFVGYMLSRHHSVYQRHQAEELPEDPGSLVLADGSSRIHLTNIGLSHFFARHEYDSLLEGFSTIDPCAASYYLPRDESARRGYDAYLQAMWIVHAVK